MLVPVAEGYLYFEDVSLVEPIFNKNAESFALFNTQTFHDKTANNCIDDTTFTYLYNCDSKYEKASPAVISTYTYIHRRTNHPSMCLRLQSSQHPKSSCPVVLLHPSSISQRPSVSDQHPDFHDPPRLTLPTLPNRLSLRHCGSGPGSPPPPRLRRAR